MLDVWVAKRAVGALDRHEASQGAYVFAYHSGFRPGEDVSLTMPWSLESYSYPNGLHPVFQMNLPEGRLRESLERSFRKRTQGFDQLSLLEVIGASQIGRLRFTNNPDLIDQVPLQSVQELIAYDGTEDLLRDLLERFSGVSGISGVQPKVLVRDQDHSCPGGGLGRLTVQGATHIVKGWDASEYPHLAANEYFCIQVAKAAGLEVPHVALSDNNRFLVIERFDLAGDGKYLGFEDFCSLNGLGTDGKYEGSYEKLAKRIRDYVAPELGGAALATFFRSLAVSCALKNGDAHLKNFGVLYEDAEKPVRFAPAYDIVSTTPYIRNDSLALTLDGSKRFPDAKRLLEFAKRHCNLQQAKARAILDEVAEAIIKTLPDLARHGRDYSDFTPICEVMLAHWRAGLDLSCGGDSVTISLPSA